MKRETSVVIRGFWHNPPPMRCFTCQGVQEEFEDKCQEAKQLLASSSILTVPAIKSGNYDGSVYVTYIHIYIYIHLRVYIYTCYICICIYVIFFLYVYYAYTDAVCT